MIIFSVVFSSNFSKISKFSRWDTFRYGILNQNLGLIFCKKLLCGIVWFIFVLVGFSRLGLLGLHQTGGCDTESFLPQGSSLHQNITTYKA